MKEFHLFDLPEELYVKLSSNLSKRIFDRAKNKVGKWCKLAKILGTHTTNVYGWKDGKVLFPIKILKALCSFVNLEEVEVEGYIESLKFRGGYINSPKLPISISENFGVVLAALLGDGGICMHSYSVHYSNTQSCLVDSFILSVRSVFGDVRIVLDTNREDNLRMLRMSGVLGRILVKTFGMPLGDKTHLDYSIPPVVLESDNCIKSKFLRRLFDDEGNVSKSTNRVSIKTTIESNEIKDGIPSRLKGLIILLSGFGIRCCSPKKVRERVHFNQKQLCAVEDWELGICDRRSLELFENKIGFELRYKMELLRNSINSYKLWETPKNESSNFFLENVKTLNKENFTSKELAKNVHRSSRRTNRVLRKLVEMGLVSKKCSKSNSSNGKLYIYSIVK
jgi:hypothetical protein